MKLVKQITSFMQRLFIAVFILTVCVILAGFIQSDTIPVPHKSNKDIGQPTLDQRITNAANEHGLDPLFLKAIIAQESSFRIDAIGELVPKIKNKIQAKYGAKSDLLARAYGLCGIMGIEAERRRIPFYHLFHVETHLSLCAEMVAGCLKHAPGKNRLEKLMHTAACHYSGQYKLTTVPQHGGPSIKEYSTEVIMTYMAYKI